MMDVAEVLAAGGLDPAAAAEGAELVPFVSPAHRATGNRIVLLADSIVRIPSPDAIAWRDPAGGVEAAVRAGELGVGPRVLWGDGATGALVTERLAGREARIEDLWGHAREQAIELLRAFHDGPPLHRRRDLFARCADLAGCLMATDAPRPPDLPELLRAVERVREAAAAGGDVAPCHLHPVASNLMLLDDGRIAAVDWDEAGMADPWWDFGALLQECCTFDDEWAAATEQVVGRADAAAIARLRLMGAADDVAWGLWAAHLSHVSPRREIEFFKYASWRFMRARMAFGDQRVDEWLRLTALG